MFFGKRIKEYFYVLVNYFMFLFRCIIWKEEIEIYFNKDKMYWYDFFFFLKRIWGSNFVIFFLMKFIFDVWIYLKISILSLLFNNLFIEILNEEFYRFFSRFLNSFLYILFYIWWLWFFIGFFIGLC